MNILLTRFPLESRYGGAEVQTMNLMNGLKKKGHDVHFLGSCPTLFAELPKKNLPVTKLDIGPPPVTKWGAISFLWRKKEMQKKLIDAISTKIHINRAGLLTRDTKRDTEYKKPDAIFMLSLTEKLLLTKWAYDRNIKVIWIEHDRVGRWLTWNPWLPKLRKLSNLATTITVSKMSRVPYIHMGWDPNRVKEIPNGIDVEKFSSIAASGKKPDFPNLKIGCIARLTNDKGVDVLINAVKNIPNVSLTIVGNGCEKKYLCSMIKNHTNITIIPSIKNIQDFYKSIDVLVLPSRKHDPFGLVIAEAMASGIPTICTNACGIKSHLNPKDSIIVPAGNIEKLRIAILNLQNQNIYQELAKHSQNIASKRFSLEHMVEAYEALLY